MKNNLLSKKTYSLSIFFTRINWIVYFFLFLLALIGSTILYSVSQGNFTPLVSSHLMKFIISSIALFTACFIKIKLIHRYSYFLYIFSIILLMLVLFLGVNDQGSNRWISLFGFTFQPSELSKIALVICLSRY